MTDNKNTIVAIVLSAVVLIAWQFFVGLPQQKARQEQLKTQQQQQQPQQKQAAPSGQTTQPAKPSAQPGAPPQPPGQTAQAPAGAAVSRAAALKTSPRIQIATDSLQGSIDLKGARIDDLALTKYHETVDPKSPPIELLSPSGSPTPFYAEFGWTGAPDAKLTLPTANTVWTQSGSGALSVGHPVTLTYDNGQGLTIPPHHFSRRQVPVHHQGRSGEQGREPGHALSLRADLAPRHAENARLLHFA